MIKCPACGTENSDGSNFCIACGIDLTATATEHRVRTDSVAEPTPGAPPLTSPSVDMPPEYQYTPPPPPVYTPPPNYTPPSSIPAYMATPASSATKDRTLAVAIEVIAGLFGFLGIGWFYGGNTTAGIAWLLGLWVFHGVAFVLDFVTLGIFVCIHVPLALVIVPVSAYMLYNYTKQHPELFGS
ncbi:MAG TPA: zinc-ribbon domain-containing protein [Anaerolineales bacterium]|nr:zinc-ribbon domain-containing protein [Anaerolineales bacterium]